ncbi:MAG: DUF1080 domain-containing protein [Planctomycetales bacterium]|nr:DUF1080 domain-containing protein [Planctomycetales bacterium]
MLGACLFTAALLVGPIEERQIVAAELEGILTDQEVIEGWIALFDGKTTFGWQPAVQCDWTVRDGAIVVTDGAVGLLNTTTQFGDYILRLEFRSPEATNSGIFLRTPEIPKNPAADCYELNIAPADNPFPTGSFVGREKATPAYRGGWRQYEVTALGDHFVVKLDGETVLDYHDPQPVKRGLIGLQHNSGPVEFRRIRLKPLGLQSAFNGRDLTGWKAYPEMPSKFEVQENGELHVQNGRGQLETIRQYGDFVLQLQCITHADQLNSGVFFRCIPGEQMNGYECQIHNGFKDGDRTQPVDTGTGGIFRRQPARKVVADDQKWFSLTLIADGAHMAAWVDGYQVSDWTDTRTADPNPRRGLRVEPGTIMLQGHDPTTDISFRNIFIGEIPPR